MLGYDEGQDTATRVGYVIGDALLALLFALFIVGYWPWH
jgi:hypothetical protein